MKEILAKHLKKGDLIYYNDTYREVLDNYTTYLFDIELIATKTYMAPTTFEIDIYSTSYIPTDVKVLLLYRKDDL